MTSVRIYLQNTENKKYIAGVGENGELILSEKLGETWALTVQMYIRLRDAYPELWTDYSKSHIETKRWRPPSPKCRRR